MEEIRRVFSLPAIIVGNIIELVEQNTDHLLSTVDKSVPTFLSSVLPITKLFFTNRKHV